MHKVMPEEQARILPSAAEGAFETKTREMQRIAQKVEDLLAGLELASLVRTLSDEATEPDSNEPSGYGKGYLQKHDIEKQYVFTGLLDSVLPHLSFETQVRLLGRSRRRRRLQIQALHRKNHCLECGFLKAKGHSPDCGHSYDPIALTLKGEEPGILNPWRRNATY